LPDAQEKKKSSLVVACLMPGHRSRGREHNGVRRICGHRAKIPVKTFPIKKRINTELFIDRSGGFMYKNKGGIGSEGLDQEISDLSEEGKKSWRKITVAGVKTAAAYLGRLTITWKEN